MHYFHYIIRQLYSCNVGFTWSLSYIGFEPGNDLRWNFPSLIAASKSFIFRFLGMLLKKNLIFFLPWFKSIWIIVVGFCFSRIGEGFFCGSFKSGKFCEFWVFLNHGSNFRICIGCDLASSIKICSP